MVRSRRCGTLLLVAILRYTRVLVFCTWFILLSSSSMTPIKEQMIKLVLGEVGIGCDFFVYGFDWDAKSISVFRVQILCFDVFVSMEFCD